MKIVLFGAGQVASDLMQWELREGQQIVAVVDNDERRWGTDFFGHAIESPEILKTCAYDVVILAVMRSFVDVYEQLIHLGVPKEKIVSAYGRKMAKYLPDPLDAFFKISKSPIVPFVKQPVKNVVNLNEPTRGRETSKAHARRAREGFFEAYCQGEGLDIGCGDDPLTMDCCGWDVCNGDAQELQSIPDESFDFVYSSHCIEHMADVRVAIANWFRVVRKGGYLIIYGPERDLYEKRKTLPSRFNPDHKHFFLVCRKEAPDTLDICEEIREALSATGAPYRIEYIKACHEGWEPLTPEVQSPGEYAFEAVIKKM